MASKAKKVSILILLFLVLITVGVTKFFYMASYSEGFRVGTLLKLSKKGYGFKTWEGELSQGFLEQSPDHGVATKIWPFSVRNSDKETLEKLQEAMAQGYRVKLHYEEKYVRIPWIGDTKYVVNDVEKVE